MERTQFTFYDSFFRALSRIKSKSARCDAYDALCKFALSGIEPDLDSMPESAAIALEVVLPNLAASRRKAESGRTGGKAKQTESKTEANDKQTESKNKDKNKNKNKIKDKCQKDEQFDTFWEAYPRKEKKAEARKAFEKVAVPLQTLLEGIDMWKGSAQWQKDNGQFIPHPSSWLNGKRWEDQPAANTGGYCNWPDGKRPMSQDEVEAIRRMMETPMPDDIPSLKEEYD